MQQAKVWHVQRGRVRSRRSHWLSKQQEPMATSLLVEGALTGMTLEGVAFMQILILKGNDRQMQGNACTGDIVELRTPAVP